MVHWTPANSKEGWVHVWNMNLYFPGWLPIKLRKMPVSYLICLICSLHPVQLISSRLLFSQLKWYMLKVKFRITLLSCRILERRMDISFQFFLTCSCIVCKRCSCPRECVWHNIHIPPGGSAYMGDADTCRRGPLVVGVVYVQAAPFAGS